MKTLFFNKTYELLYFTHVCNKKIKEDICTSKLFWHARVIMLLFFGLPYLKKFINQYQNNIRSSKNYTRTSKNALILV